MVKSERVARLRFVSCLGADDLQVEDFDFVSARDGVPVHVGRHVGFDVQMVVAGYGVGDVTFGALDLASAPLFCEFN